MTLKAICLPPLRVAARQGGLQLSLRSSVTADFPHSLQDIESNDDLKRAVKEGQLWMARLGYSRLTVTLTNSGRPFDASSSEAVALWIQGQQIWHRLGVRLVYSEPPSPYSPGTFSFTIEHPDLSSAMAAPGNALTAEFRAVTCALDVSTRVTEYQLVEDKPKGHPRKSQKKKKQAFTLGLDDDEDCCNLGLDDRMAIDRFISSFDGIREGSPKSAVGLKRKRVEKVTPVTDIISARGLFEAAVEILLFGGTRRCIGFKVLEGESLTGLVHLAPGVFHIPYLTGVSKRAGLVPTMATSLARMANAESPRLRKKVEEFKSDMEALGNDAELTIRGIEKGTWEVLLKNIKMPALKPRPASKQPDTPPQPVQPEEKPERQPLVLFKDPMPTPPEAARQGQPKTLELWDNPPLPAMETPISYSPCASPAPYSQVITPQFSPQADVYRDGRGSPGPLYWPHAPTTPAPATHPLAWQPSPNGYPTPYRDYFPSAGRGPAPWAQQANTKGPDPVYYGDGIYGQMRTGTN